MGIGTVEASVVRRWWATAAALGAKGATTALVVVAAMMARAAGALGATAATAVREQTTIVIQDGLGVAAVAAGAGGRAAILWDAREAAWVSSVRGPVAQAEVLIILASRALAAAAAPGGAALEHWMIVRVVITPLREQAAAQCGWCGYAPRI